MATMGGIFIPDYDGSQASGLVGTIATTASTGAIVLGKYRLWKLTLVNQTTPPNSGVCAVRFTTGISVAPGHTAPTPTSASPFLHSFHENFFEFDGSIDSINLANLTADNGSITIGYCLLPLTRN